MVTEFYKLTEQITATHKKRKNCWAEIQIRSFPEQNKKHTHTPYLFGVSEITEVGDWADGVSAFG